MIKRILVALDIDQDSDVATRYASEIARRYDAVVSGLALVHTQRIAAEVGPGGAVGGQYYAQRVRDALTAKTHRAAREILERFESILDADGVANDSRVREGVPYRRIVEEMKTHDLLVIGRTPHFFYPQPGKRTQTLTRVVKEGIIPTLIVPEEHRAVKHVLLAYDGSEAATRTMHRFAQLKPFGSDLEVEVLHVRGWVSDASRRASELMLERTACYLGAHEFARVRKTSLEMDDPPRRVLAYAKEVNTDLIVASAHSVSAISRMTFGSTTHTLLKECEVPFFMYH